MAKPRTKIKAVLSSWAIELGVAIQTIQRKLVKHGIPFEAGDELSARDIFRVLFDAREEALTRQAIAEADALERENKKADDILVDLSKADAKIWNEILLPVKTELDLLPDKMAALVNPSNPNLAYDKLSEWVEETKRQIKQRSEAKERKTK